MFHVSFGFPGITGWKKTVRVLKEKKNEKTVVLNFLIDINHRLSDVGGQTNDWTN